MYVNGQHNFLISHNMLYMTLDYNYVYEMHWKLLLYLCVPEYRRCDSHNCNVSFSYQLVISSVMGHNQHIVGICVECRSLYFDFKIDEFYE